MSGQDGEIRALRQLVHEIREQPAPTLDWEELERRVMSQADRESAVPASGSSWRWKVAGVALAATAMFAAGVGTLRTLDTPLATTPASSSTSTQTGDRIDGDKLPIGRRIVAGTTPVVVEHAGRASWTLKPHSHAWLSATGERLTLRLGFGAVVASVVPSEVDESFAVEAGQSRIAVHGTVFSVELSEDYTQVEVQQGTVSVRAIDGHDQGWLLSAPATGRFSLDGHRLDTTELKPARRSAAMGPRRSAGPIAQPSAAESSSLASDVTSRPDDAQLELAADKVGDVVRRCFTQTTSNPGAVHVSASSNMTVRFGADGKLEQLEFDPPLAPSVQACSQSGVQSIAVERSRDGAAVSRVVHLG
jgi:hypothetical protein